MATLESLKSTLYNKIWRRNTALPLLEEIKRAGRIVDIVTLLGSVFQRKEEETVRRFVADVFAGEILEIADNANDNGKTGDDKDDIARSKLRIDTRKWLMAHLAPAQYGDGAAAANDRGKSSFFAPRLYIPENGRD